MATVSRMFPLSKPKVETTEVETTVSRPAHKQTISQYLGKKAGYFNPNIFIISTCVVNTVHVGSFRLVDAHGAERQINFCDCD